MPGVLRFRQNKPRHLKSIRDGDLLKFGKPPLSANPMRELCLVQPTERKLYKLRLLAQYQNP